ncbi:MAG: hypothetical protein ACRD2J_00550 [Thermoanaerobaculia bacterium]
MKLARVLVACGFVFLLAHPAAALVDGGETDYEESNDPCEGIMDVDECFWSPMGFVGGNFWSCYANGRWGQRCYDVVTVFKDDGTSFQACAKVKYTAHCGCDTTKLETKGHCEFTWPQ